MKENIHAQESARMLRDSTSMFDHNMTAIKMHTMMTMMHMMLMIVMLSQQGPAQRLEQQNVLSHIAERWPSVT